MALVVVSRAPGRCTELSMHVPMSIKVPVVARSRSPVYRVWNLDLLLLLSKVVPVVSLFWGPGHRSLFPTCAGSCFGSQPPAWQPVVGSQAGGEDPVHGLLLLERLAWLSPIVPVAVCRLSPGYRNLTLRVSIPVLGRHAWTWVVGPLIFHPWSRFQDRKSWATYRWLLGEFGLHAISVGV